MEERNWEALHDATFNSIRNFDPAGILSITKNGVHLHKIPNMILQQYE